ncbi:uncharacterized protein PV09_01479 [Verruconis gallopava]|uniref:Heterokaryon incompatibility domain-containing protein n=1 Tax=Verruconis gallopava TaxID=253628 RepID=A0A0D2AM43_9PEZI|nr:uncharacterized protein PV09_01479 [Verruconis gallopava]KIW07515.1 hypothetical protein PV09_01479 [Verruconis gallopava]
MWDKSSDPSVDDSNPKSQEVVTTSCNPTAYEPYECLPLDKRGRHRRLFQFWRSPSSEHLEIDLQHFDLRTAPPFRAVSYVWGPPPATRAVLVGGKSAQDTRKPREAFPGLWGPPCKDQAIRGPDLLWADQVRVHQGCNEERNHQVQMMGQIFTRADEVLVWLGADRAGTSAFRAIERISEESTKINALIHTREGVDDRQALKDFAHNPYWDRLWVVQETVLAKNLALFIHRSKLDGYKFERFCRNVMDFHPIIHNCSLFDFIAKERTRKFLRDQSLRNPLLDACIATCSKIVDYNRLAEQVLLDAAVKICNSNQEVLEY